MQMRKVITSDGALMGKGNNSVDASTGCRSFSIPVKEDDKIAMTRVKNLCCPCSARKALERCMSTEQRQFAHGVME